MDYSTLAQQIGQDIGHQIAQEIYHQIVWQYIVYAAKVGVFAGVVIAIVATILGMLKFTTLNLTNYTGCLITGQAKGIAPFIAGLIFHLVVSALFGVGYLYLINKLQIPGTILFGVLLGLAHTVLAGGCMALLDRIHPCVARKAISKVGFAGSAQGSHAVITYTLIHVLYAVIVVYMLTH